MKSSGWITAVLLFLPAFSPGAVNDTEAPTLRYMFPLGAARGSSVRSEMFGDSLKGAYAVWCKTPGVTGRVEKIEANSDTTLGPSKGPADPGEKPPAERVAVVLEISTDVPVGEYDLRLVSPRGLSTPLSFRVDSDPALAEVETPHSSPFNAQSIKLPVVLNGRISKPGEVDYYAFKTAPGRRLVFESLSAEGITPELRLYRAGGSWLNPDRPLPIMFEERRTSTLIPNTIRYTWSPRDAGAYLLEVGSLYGIGGPYFAYEVRIAPADEAEPSLKPAPAQTWLERSFDRKLGAGWLEEIRSRTVEVPPSKEENKTALTAGAGGDKPASRTPPNVPAEPVVMPVAVREAEPDNTPAQARTLSIPALVEGSIEKPGDIDYYRLKMKAGQKVAFEVETPGSEPPYFLPEITLIDVNGHEVVSNLEEHSAPMATDGHPISYLKRIDPKVVYAAQVEGEYIVKVRDITSRYGDPHCDYRLLIRPQIPHVGEISVKNGDQVNLVRGEATKISVEAAAEEGFEGEVVYEMTGLPPGVEALPGAAPSAGKIPDMVEHEENLAPHVREAVIVLMAKSEAALTRLPAVTRLEFRPVVDGHPGSPHLVREIPLMVVEKRENK